MDRQFFLGGSDAAAVLGVSPWRSPIELYLEKTTPRAEEPSAGKMKVFTRGKKMEPYVCDILAEETGLSIMKRNERYIDAEYSFLACEIDAETKDANIEIKTVSPFKAREWGEQQTDEIPVAYTAQAMHGLMITGRDVCIFGVLIGGDDFRIYRVERDDEIIAGLRRRECDFWHNHVVPRIPPEPTTLNDVRFLYGKDSGIAIEANAEIMNAAASLKLVKENIGELSKAAAALEERIQLYMRDAAILTVNGKPVATWRTHTRSDFDQTAFKAANQELFERFKKTTEIRTFRIK